MMGQDWGANRPDCEVNETLYVRHVVFMYNTILELHSNINYMMKYNCATKRQGNGGNHNNIIFLSNTYVALKSSGDPSSTCKQLDWYCGEFKQVGF